MTTIDYTLSLNLYYESGLFRSYRYTNFITAIAEATKIIKLNHVYLYDLQTDHI